ncbi:DUF4291 domain-containing protein [Terrimonas rubra]|uniref:DUF4291 domain-containing protein n=1 Tax=Terrimonas rubra TaxID=1035890 RepID=A0ABW6A9B1_9BACT
MEPIIKKIKRKEMKTERYVSQVGRLPENGKQIIGYTEEENIIVYQAFNPRIADYAVQYQQFGGTHYSFNRMSWIKPGFLWMMHRAGWAQKEHQQKILAITLPMIHFKTILREATLSSYHADIYPTRESWKDELQNTEVRLQWDPDHDPYGNKQERKAIQLGLKGNILKNFCTNWITKIEDITGFVQEQYQFVQHKEINNLIIPYEEVIVLNDTIIEKRIGITNHEQD